MHVEHKERMSSPLFASQEPGPQLHGDATDTQLSHLFQDSPLPSTNIHTGIPDLQRWPKTFGYPEISGGTGDIKDYYEQFLQKAHPEWDEKKIKRRTTQGLKDRHVRKFLEAMMEADEKIRQEYPQWTTWFDNFYKEHR
jgi:hypothetical protein